MLAAVEYVHVEKPQNGPARLRRLPRIRVAQIAMDYLAHGWSPDEMCRQHADLFPAEAHAAMAYYFDHQAEVDAEILAECREADAALEASRDHPSPLRLKLLAARSAVVGS
jgi:hypothetical protein